MKKLLVFLSLASLFFAACNNSVSSNQTTNGSKDSSAIKKDSTAPKMGAKIETKNGITLSYFIQSPDFADAALNQIEPANNSQISKAGSTAFRYDIKNFKLTDQTPGVADCGCNNSNKGQHIHQILNNAPYMARYKDTFYSDLKPGNYINLSFLSRSYHESVKNKNAYALSQFKVGDTKEKPADLKGPLLFYSRPKGEYKGKDTANILLDFYLVNRSEEHTSELQSPMY